MNLSSETTMCAIMSVKSLAGKTISKMTNSATNGALNSRHVSVCAWYESIAIKRLKSESCGCHRELAKWLASLEEKFDHKIQTDWSVRWSYTGIFSTSMRSVRNSTSCHKWLITGSRRSHGFSICAEVDDHEWDWTVKMHIQRRNQCVIRWAQRSAHVRSTFSNLLVLICFKSS